MENEPGTRLSRRARLERERPGLYAARHFAKGVGKGLLALIGVAVLVRFLPELPLPSIDLPEPPLPSIGVPEPPRIEPPGWLKSVLGTKAIWLPILIGAVLALRERRRRRPR